MEDDRLEKLKQLTEIQKNSALEERVEALEAEVANLKSTIDTVRITLSDEIFANGIKNTKLINKVQQHVTDITTKKD